MTPDDAGRSIPLRNANKASIVPKQRSGIVIGMSRVALLAAAVVLTAGCGGSTRFATVQRVAISPWPEGPTLVASSKTGLGKKLLSTARTSLPAVLPANSSPQRCKLGTTVTIVAATTHVYGPCAWPASIERLREALINAAAPNRTAAHAPALRVPATAWRAVFRDWYDGRMDHWHSCAAVREAMRHLPSDGPIYSTIALDLQAYERGVCWDVHGNS